MADDKALYATFLKYKAAVPKIAKTVLSDQDKANLMKKIDIALAALKLSIDSHDKLIDEKLKFADERGKFEKIFDTRQTQLNKKIGDFKKIMSGAQKESAGVKSWLAGSKDQLVAKIAHDFEAAGDAFYASDASISPYQ